MTASYGGGGDFAASTSAPVAAGGLAGWDDDYPVAVGGRGDLREGAGRARVRHGLASVRRDPGRTGSVTVDAGSATICTITLASGSGSCALSATEFPAGTVQLTASYDGNADFAASKSGAMTLTVSEAGTTTQPGTVGVCHSLRR